MSDPYSRRTRLLKLLPCFRRWPTTAASGCSMRWPALKSCVSLTLQRRRRGHPQPPPTPSPASSTAASWPRDAKEITSTIGSSTHACPACSRSDCAWPKRPAGCLTSRRRPCILAANHPRRPGAKHPDLAGRAERLERGRYENGQLLTKEELRPSALLP